MIDLRDVYWLAGLLEGEGCFSTDRGTYPRVFLRMTDEDIVGRARDVVGVGAIHLSKPAAVGWKPSWCWQVSGPAPGLMMMFYPLMGERRKARIAEILRAWRSSSIKPRPQRHRSCRNPSKERSCYSSM